VANFCTAVLSFQCIEEIFPARPKFALGGSDMAGRVVLRQVAGVLRVPRIHNEGYCGYVAFR